MFKYIEKLRRTLVCEFVTVWVLAAAIVVAGETGLIPNGLVEPHSNIEFILNTTIVLITIGGIPLALRLFSLNITRGLRRMDYDEALRSYHVWSAVRLGILLFASLLGITTYYLTMSVSAAMCGLIALVVTLYCWPSGEKISAYLESVNNE